MAEEQQDASSTYGGQYQEMMIGDSLPRCSITAETEFRGPPQKKKKAIKPNVEYLRVIYYMRENAEK